MKRREVKGKGEKQRYTHLNAEFQRIARRDKKPFLYDQCKTTTTTTTEENNRMGKTRVGCHALLQGIFLTLGTEPRVSDQDHPQEKKMQKAK